MYPSFWLVKYVGKMSPSYYQAVRQQNRKNTKEDEYFFKAMFWVNMEELCSCILMVVNNTLSMGMQPQKRHLKYVVLREAPQSPSLCICLVLLFSLFNIVNKHTEWMSLVCAVSIMNIITSVFIINGTFNSVLKLCYGISSKDKVLIKMLNLKKLTICVSSLFHLDQCNSKLYLLMWKVIKKRAEFMIIFNLNLKWVIMNRCARITRPGFRGFFVFSYFKKSVLHMNKMESLKRKQFKCVWSSELLPSWILKAWLLIGQKQQIPRASIIKQLHVQKSAYTNYCHQLSSTWDI